MFLFSLNCTSVLQLLKTYNKESVINKYVFPVSPLLSVFRTNRNVVDVFTVNALQRAHHKENRYADFLPIESRYRMLLSPFSRDPSHCQLSFSPELSQQNSVLVRATLPIEAERTQTTPSRIGKEHPPGQRTINPGKHTVRDDVVRGKLRNS